MRNKAYPILTILILAIYSVYTVAQSSNQTRFAVIGDYGCASQAEANIASMVQGWDPDFIITTGDNNYDEGSASTIDENIGRYYSQFIHPYKGIYGQGASTNRFFPSLGNHDWIASNASPYLNYFTLPGNERYYDTVIGTIHIFSIDSDENEPDGTSSSSIQAQWLQNELTKSTARWNIVYFHHPPFSSGTEHGSSVYMQWPFQEWGATAVINGHEHNYERVDINDFTYMVNGLGGKGIYGFGKPLSGSIIRYCDDYGAQIVTANNDSIVFEFYTQINELIDRFVIRSIPNGVTDIDLTYKNFNLKQNYPNPFTTATTISFTIPKPSLVRLKVLDLLGIQIASLVEKQLNPGVYNISFDGSGLTTGVYLYRLEAGDFSQTRKFIIQK